MVRAPTRVMLPRISRAREYHLFFENPRAHLNVEAREGICVKRQSGTVLLMTFFWLEPHFGHISSPLEN